MRLCQDRLLEQLSARVSLRQRHVELDKEPSKPDEDTELPPSICYSTVTVELVGMAAVKWKSSPYVDTAPPVQPAESNGDHFNLSGRDSVKTWFYCGELVS